MRQSGYLPAEKSLFPDRPVTRHFNEQTIESIRNSHHLLERRPRKNLGPKHSCAVFRASLTGGTTISGKIESYG
jgi:hypothetical protein